MLVRSSPVFSCSWPRSGRANNQATSPHEVGPDLNRRTWLRKGRDWRRPIHIVCPSHWLADWPFTVILNPIDLNV